MFDELYKKLLENDSSRRLPDQLDTSFVKNQVLERLLKKDKPQIDILEIGVGLSTLFDDESLSKDLQEIQTSVISIDLSKHAIEYLTKFEHPLGGAHKFLIQDFLQSHWVRSFDLIIDTSCFHCLCSEQEQMRYLKRVKNSLKLDGLFFLQSMVRPKNMALEEIFEFDEKSAVLKKYGKDWRRLLEAFEIENALKKAQLEIDYFKVFNDQKVILSDERTWPMSSDPEVLRLIAQASNHFNCDL